MKKKLMYGATLIVCLCMFNTASKECDKVINEKCSGNINATKISAEKKITEEGDGKADFSLMNLLFFQTT